MALVFLATYRSPLSPAAKIKKAELITLPTAMVRTIKLEFLITSIKPKASVKLPPIELM